MLSRRAVPVIAILLLSAAGMQAGEHRATLSFHLARLAEGPCIAKGRLQDATPGESKERRQTVERIMQHGTESIEALTAALIDSRPVHHPVLCSWHGMAIGDVALIALLDLFRGPNLQSTVPDLEWDRFLERSSPGLSKEEVLREFIRKHHRSGLQKKWERFWNEHRDEVIWYVADKCYRLRPGHPE